MIFFFNNLSCCDNINCLIRAWRSYQTYSISSLDLLTKIVCAFLYQFYIPDSSYFWNFQDAMNCAEDFFKFFCKWVWDNCPEDIKVVSKRIDKTCIDRLQSLIYSKVEKITYAEVVDVLGKVYTFLKFLGHNILMILFTSNGFHLVNVFKHFLPGWRQEVWNRTEVGCCSHSRASKVCLFF